MALGTVLAYAALAAIVVFGLFVVWRLIRSWKAAGRRWGDSRREGS